MTVFHGNELLTRMFGKSDMGLTQLHVTYQKHDMIRQANKLVSALLCEPSNFRVFRTYVSSKSCPLLRCSRGRHTSK